MKTTQLNRNGNKGFTLIEMIGVLAVIAILAALLIPKIFDSINSARVNNAAVSYNTVKAAMADHYAKFGTLLSANGTVFALGSQAATNYDTMVLLTEGFIDKPFQVKIGSAPTHIEAVAGLDGTNAITALNTAYDLDGTSQAPINDAGPSTATVIQAVITDVAETDAKDLNDRLDGAALGSNLGTSDIKGRVKYATANPTTVYVYVTHR